MAFEVFDDVAFYWFLQVILGIFLIPYSINRLHHWCTETTVHRKNSHPFVDNIPSYIPKKRLVSEEDKIDSYLSLKNVFWAAMWILFILLLIQLPKWHNRQMTNFEPFEILSVAKGSNAAQIKRAYRKMSLKYHPDKCTKAPLSMSSEKCKDMFIMVRKAYETLTDEATKENIEKYGNPDGYQGTHVTIGLPSFLTLKQNETWILITYFSILVLLCTLVYIWWNYSSKFHKSGVYKQSINIYWRFIKTNMTHRHLLDILAASSEFRILDVKMNTEDKLSDMRLIEENIVKLIISKDNNGKKAKINPENMLNVLFSAKYSHKACALLHCHLMGMKVPQSLKEEYLFVLQEAPRLLDVMIDMTLARERFWIQGLQLIQLKQAIIQGVWWRESKLKQLPHWTPAIDHGLRKVKCETILQLNHRTPVELKELLSSVYSQFSDDHSHLISPLNEDGNESIDEIRISSSNMKDGGKGRKSKWKNKKKKKRKNKSEVKEEEDGSETDDTDNEMNNISVDTNDDLPLPGSLATDEEVQQMVEDAISCVRMYPFVKMDWCARTYEETDIFHNDVVKVSVHLQRIREPWDLNHETFKAVNEMIPPEFKNKRTKDETEDETDDGSNEYDDEHGLDFVDNELEDARRLQIARLNAPVVHANKFPFRIREKWILMLVDKSIPAVIDQRAIPDLSGLRKVDLHFRMQRKAGVYPYMLIVKCDSYLGADKHVSFDIVVQEQKKKVVEGVSDDEDGREIDYEIPEEMEEADPKWYYLWNENFWEGLLTIFLLYFLYLVIVSSSWGKRYIQPYVDQFANYCIYPYVSYLNDRMYEYLITPVTVNLLKITGLDVFRYWAGMESYDDDEFYKAQTDYEQFEKAQAEGSWDESQM